MAEETVITDRIPQSTDSPHLTPQFCYNQTALRDFLRLSRATLDDSISANLNALLRPSPFNPSGVSNPSAPRSPTGRRRNDVPPQACSQFAEKILLPSWYSREQVLTYCSAIASSSTNNSSEPISQPAPAFLKTYTPPAKAAANSDFESPLTDVSTTEPDERLDPYSARNFPLESRSEELARVVRNERMVEQIVRARTWGVLRERCGDDVVARLGWSAEVALSRWVAIRTGVP